MKSNIDIIKDRVIKTTPESIVSVIAAQLDRLDEAKRRIAEEGIVVRDLKGSVVAHPAIKIESDATKLIADLLRKHRKR